MKKIVVMLCVLLFCTSAFGAEYPELGVCTGDNVRLREDPGTDGKIIGRADTGTRFVILSEAYVDGQKWYEIDNPKDKGHAFIIARYVNYGWYHGNNGVIPTGKDFVEVRLAFGIYQEKARTLLGEGKKDEFGNLVYSGCTLRYDDEAVPTIHQAEITKRGYAIAGVQVGDNMRKLLQLGMPEDYLNDFIEIQKGNAINTDDDGVVDGPEGWTYESASGESIFFQFGVGQKGESIVDMIIWSRPLGEG